MKTILVTGGLGYIGSHTVVALQKAGFRVCIIDDLSLSEIQVLDRIQRITGVLPEFAAIDLKNETAVFEYFKTNTIAGVVHFAAYKAVGESVNSPLKYYKNNVLSLLNVLEAMALYGVKNIIFSSSCTVYGQALEMPIHEKTPIAEQESPYGNTKKIGEEIIADFTKAHESTAIILRYFNPIGSDDSGLLGDKQNIPNNLLPYIVQTASGIKAVLGVFGKDYPTKDGTAVRDYIDVNDLADAHVKALQRLLQKKNTEALEFFNLGSGTGSTVLEIITAFEKANDIKIPFEIKPRRAGDIAESYADYSLAKKELGWEPTTSLETSMKTAWKFQQQLGKF